MKEEVSARIFMADDVVKMRGEHERMKTKTFQCSLSLHKLAVNEEAVQAALILQGRDKWVRPADVGNKREASQLLVNVVYVFILLHLVQISGYSMTRKGQTDCDHMKYSVH